MTMRTALLAHHPEAFAELAQGFEAQWPDWYGASGRGDALADLHTFARTSGLPLGVVVLDGPVVCGVAALKAQSIDAFAHWGPWAAAGYVSPEKRGQGLGAILLRGLVQEAARQGHEAVYCGTATATRLLEREGWRWCAEAKQNESLVQVYRINTAT
ncbi:GNAT family N-acetyltransferase [Ideonella sp.]|jgi:GNAT superfamily N-acetyltransferase|uniref:GNAT family N-acetyltransferase n=1 Tax=Ideonella sp. TaxID=1929293 RepID=UPI0037C03342